MKIIRKIFTGLWPQRAKFLLVLCLLQAVIVFSQREQLVKRNVAYGKMLTANKEALQSLRRARNTLKMAASYLEQCVETKKMLSVICTVDGGKISQDVSAEQFVPTGGQHLCAISPANESVM